MGKILIKSGRPYPRPRFPDTLRRGSLWHRRETGRGGAQAYDSAESATRYAHVRRESHIAHVGPSPVHPLVRSRGRATGSDTFAWRCHRGSAGALRWRHLCFVTAIAPPPGVFGKVQRHSRASGRAVSSHVLRSAWSRATACGPHWGVRRAGPSRTQRVPAPVAAAIVGRSPVFYRRLRCRPPARRSLALEPTCLASASGGFDRRGDWCGSLPCSPGPPGERF